MIFIFISKKGLNGILSNPIIRDLDISVKNEIH